MSRTNFKGVFQTLIQATSIVLFILLFHADLTAQTPKKERIKTLYANGKIKENGIKRNGLKEGNWLIYSAEGWLEKRIKYKNDSAVWQVFYDSKQRKVKMIDKNGQEVPYKGCNCKN
jgi:DNA-dependent RNA polymerase auxiliary subunit epsilon